MTFVCPISRRGQIDGVTSLVVLARSKGEFVNLLLPRLKTAERKGNLLESIVLQADLEKSVAKTIRKQKEFRCVASQAIVLSEQNGLFLSKDNVYLLLQSHHFMLCVCNDLF